MRCLHSIFILASEHSRRDIYEMVEKYLMDGYVVVYGVAADSGTSKGNLKDQVRRKIRGSSASKEVKARIEKGLLHVIDIRESCFVRKSFQPSRFLEMWVDIVSRVRKSSEYKGLVVIAGGTAPMANPAVNNRLARYEQTVVKVITELGSVQVVCCYRPETLNKMDFSALIAIAGAHQCVMTSGADRKEISDLVLLEAIYSGIEKVLGAGSPKLIFQTMKMIYRLDEKAIVANPGVFEEKLHKVLGHASNAVLKSISEQVRSLL